MTRAAVTMDVGFDRGTATVLLRKKHAEYLKSCGDRFADRPFASSAVPGWIYYPKRDVAKPGVIMPFSL